MLKVSFLHQCVKNQSNKVEFDPLRLFPRSGVYNNKFILRNWLLFFKKPQCPTWCFVALMPGFNNQTEGSWPLEIQGKFNRFISWRLNWIWTQNWGDFLTKSTLMVRINSSLVMFQAHSKFCRTTVWTFSTRSSEAFTASIIWIFSQFVHKTF